MLVWRYLKKSDRFKVLISQGQSLSVNPGTSPPPPQVTTAPCVCGTWTVKPASRRSRLTVRRAKRPFTTWPSTRPRPSSPRLEPTLSPGSTCRPEWVRETRREGGCWKDLGFLNTNHRRRRRARSICLHVTNGASGQHKTCRSKPGSPPHSVATTRQWRHYTRSAHLLGWFWNHRGEKKKSTDQIIFVSECQKSEVRDDARWTSAGRRERRNLMWKENFLQH